MSNPFIIGVTGHRDIHPDAVNRISTIVDTWLDEQISIHGKSNIVIQSPLAAGADQLVALLAREKGINLSVPLPFPVERYQKDFSEKDRELFIELIHQAQTVSLVPFKNNIYNRYFAVGAYIAQTSNSLLALWNGKTTPELEGGTAHILRCQFQGFPKELRMPGCLTNRNTHWLITPRATEIIGDIPKLMSLTKQEYKTIIQQGE